MQFFLNLNGNLIGPMTAQQVIAYNVNPNTSVSTDGVNWQPLYVYPELMQAYNAQQNMAQMNQSADSKRVLAGVMAILFGVFGVQYFICGKTAGGLITILLSIVTCGAWEIITFIQGIMMLCMSDAEFNRKYVESTSTMPLF